MGLCRITSTSLAMPALFDNCTSRAIETAALGTTPAFSLMAQAGAQVAQLALAMAPHARHIWVAAGPGNNGGDGLVAATALHRVGKQVHLTRLGHAKQAPADAQRALTQALTAGVVIAAEPPSTQPDLVIDALLGLGQSRPPEGTLAELIRSVNAAQAPVLAVDLPTGLCADTGRALGEQMVRADATLALLTLKPGLFTGHGRDAAGQVWWSDLGLSVAPDSGATALLTGPTDVQGVLPARAHASHKGRHGDLWVIGGAPGMGGAAVLAGRAGLAAGAGRVFLGMLESHTTGPDPAQPELMHRPTAQWRSGAVFEQATVVCGCGGSDAVRRHLPMVLHQAARLVLDADALNAVAADPMLMQALQARGRRGQPTVLTPHPLEAARLAGLETSTVQANRLAVAQQLADQFGAVLVLKGSGTVVAAPGELPALNPSGNARLATAGTGDVLAGWLGGLWTQQAEGPNSARAVARAAVWLHGHAAELDGRGSGPMRLRLPMLASQLIANMVQASEALA
ncbi:MAG: NAD(P)H-hydrate dehydratase [Vitreoscilla sp.]|nr:NAD(P)H-hydrate dehydratase [Vitreoscilla sp.]MBP6673693.1 NAD(P)H-hydrate dehydratase [Vitreoscilla sp.]